MAFEIFTRKIHRGKGPSVSFTTNGRMAFNKSATDQLEKVGAEKVFVMWDKDNNRIGIRPTTKKDPRTYDIHYSKKGNGSGFSASTFLKHIGYKETETHTLLASWEEQEGILVVEVPEEYLSREKQQSTLPIPGEGKGSRLRR